MWWYGFHWQRINMLNLQYIYSFVKLKVLLAFCERADFPRFLHKSVRHRSLTLHFEPFRVWLRIRGDIRNRKRTPRFAESGSRQGGQLIMNPPDPDPNSSLYRYRYLVELVIFKNFCCVFKMFYFLLLCIEKVIFCVWTCSFLCFERGLFCFLRISERSNVIFLSFSLHETSF